MQAQKRALAIHDISCVGRCSLTVALPILSAAGVDTAILPTAVLSTHTGGFTGYTFRDLTEDIRPIEQHWASLGLAFDAIYTGYLGSLAQVALVEEVASRHTAQGGFVLVDPVMGDGGKLYPGFGADFPAAMAGLCRKADVIVPNFTEAALLLGRPYQANFTPAEVDALLADLAELAQADVVLTGVWEGDSLLGAACLERKSGRISRAMAPYIPGYFHGTGDVFGSALTAALLCGQSLSAAMQTAVTYTQRSIDLTRTLAQEARYGVCFEKALPELLRLLGIA